MIAKGKLLIVDDDQAVRESLSAWCECEGYRALAVPCGDEALAALDQERWEVALVDIRMPGMDGVELLGRLHASHPDLAVIIITGYASVETAVRTLKNGACDYIVKPFDPEELGHAVSRALERSRSRREVERLRHKLDEVSPKADLVGQSAAMKRVIEQVETVGSTDVPVVITGERGTGKEIVARAIHAGSPRRWMPLAIVRCGAMKESLLDLELFGHEPGAGPDAGHRRKGKFEIADGGTVFLDEINEVSARQQTDLVRVLDSQEITRLGGGQSVRVDVRWIAASNRSLQVAVRDGSFRSDLHSRLNGFAVDLPPLRDRREDIPILVDHFLRKHAAATNRPVPRVAKKAMDLLLACRWPGNVRELENAVERALLLGRGDEIQPADFPFQLGAGGEQPHQSLQDVERWHIERVVEQTNWNLSRSARILRIDRTTLYNKLRRYGLR